MNTYNLLLHKVQSWYICYNIDLEKLVIERIDYPTSLTHIQKINLSKFHGYLYGIYFRRNFEKLANFMKIGKLNSS